MASVKHIAIAGAGLVGSLLASILARKGYKVEIYERRQDMRKQEIGGGRSINLALSDRGWKALEIAGIARKVREMAIPMYGRMIHNLDGSEVFQPYGKENQAIYSVSRGGLNMLLMDHAEELGVDIFFEKGCEEVDINSTTMNTSDGGLLSPDVIFGADGAFSKVRLSMMMTDRYDHEQFYLKHAYKELSIPAGNQEKWQIEKNALHIWPRHSFMLIALPNIDGSFTCTLFAPFEGKNSFEGIQDKKSLKIYFKEHFPDALELMPSLEEDFFTNPTSSLVTVKCYPWVKENTALIGDAAHAIVPFYGQGMNAGFEDCTVMHQLLEQYNDWNDILNKYQEARKENGDAIADLAIQNFIEMRDLVADPKFLLRKKIEKQLQTLMPEHFVPLYSMVTFSDRPYNEALKEGKLQEEFFNDLFSRGIVHDNISKKEINNLREIWLNDYKFVKH